MMSAMVICSWPSLCLERHDLQDKSLKEDKNEEGNFIKLCQLSLYYSQYKIALCIMLCIWCWSGKRTVMLMCGKA